MTRIVILSVLVLAALCQVYGAQKKPGYGPLLREVRQALFKRRNQQRSETHYWCWEVLEQHRESICYEAPPPTKPPQPTHNHDPTTHMGYTKPPPTHKSTDQPKPSHKPTFAPGPTQDPNDGHNVTDGKIVAPFGEFVGAREAKGFLMANNIQNLHEECCYEGCDVEEVDESC